MTKVSVAINGRTWFTYVLRRGGLDLSAFVDEGDSECSEPRVISGRAIGRAWAAAGATPTLPVGPGVSFLRCTHKER
jgi:hypothetical protein